MKKRSSLIWSAVWFTLSACEFTLLAVGIAKKVFSALTAFLTAVNAALTLTLGILHLCDYLRAEDEPEAPEDEPAADDAGNEGTLEITVE